jgi:hypothetical protein
MPSLRVLGVLSASLLALDLFAGATRGDEPRPDTKPTADSVLKDWKPKAAGKRQEFAAMGGSPKAAPDVVALSFRLDGWSFEEVWNFYADKCGVEDRYKEKTILSKTGAGPKGDFVVADRVTALEANATRAVTTFLLKADGYTAVVSFHPGPDGKAIFGSIAVVVK